MDNRTDSESGPDRVVLTNKLDSKIKGEKRVSVESGSEDQHSPRKRVKMRDLDLVCRSYELNSQHKKSSKNNMDYSNFLHEKIDESRVTKAPRPLDLNTEICFRKDRVLEDGPECSKSDSDFGTSRGIGLDLNSEDVSSSMNKDHPFIPYKSLNQTKPRDISECASSTGPMEEKDPLRVWKQMKENGFLSTLHGGIPIPKQRAKKTKTDALKKKIEIAKREQVDRFTKIAAPSGLLNELNPGIINHVRNRKQVHSIIKALVRSEKHKNAQVGNKLSSHSKGGATEVIVNSSDLALLHSGHNHEDRQANTASWVRQARGFPTTSLVRCPSILETKGVVVESNQSNVSLKTGEDALALKLSSSSTTTKNMSKNESSLSNEDSASFLSIKAASVASQWLELLHQDIKGRLAALRRSKKRVRAVISTELPFLLSKEFAYDQENDPDATKSLSDRFSHNNAVSEMHRARWSLLFDQMDKSLCEEEKQLECWMNQVREMQLRCEQGLHQANSFLQFDFRSPRSEISEREMAVRATAASIYSTCNYILTENNVSCF